jgi:RNase P/RNase MRP subunit POP5
LKKPYRKRYISFEIISDSEIRENLIEKAILDEIKGLFGTVGLSEAYPKLLIEFSKDTKHVLQIDHRYVQKAKLAMAMIKEINKKPLIIKSIKVYGTLKKIKWG